MMDSISETIPKFYGSATVGERGQIAIPAEARREMMIEAGAKLLVFGTPNRQVLLLLNAEFASELLSSVADVLSRFEGTSKGEAG